MVGESRRARPKIEAIKSVRKILIQAIAPASEEFIMTKIETLQSRYHNQEVGTNQTVNDILDEEWIEDLAEYPPDIIVKACKNWRTSGDSRGFAPRDAGQLMASVKMESAKRKLALRNADSIIELLTEEN